MPVHPNFPESSSTYATELVPEPCLRRLVTAMALAGYLLGLAIVLLWQPGATTSVLVVIAWTALTLVEWLLLTAGQKRFCRIRIDARGAVTLLDREGQWQDASLRSDSVVLARVAWLGLKPEHRPRYFELLRGNCRENEQWRRLQLIWRHVGRAGRSC